MSSLLKSLVRMNCVSVIFLFISSLCMSPESDIVSNESSITRVWYCVHKSMYVDKNGCACNEIF